MSSTVYNSPDGTPDEDNLMVVRNAREALLASQRASFVEQHASGKPVPAFATPDGTNTPPPGWTAQTAMRAVPALYGITAPKAGAKSESAEAEVAENKPSGKSKGKTTRSAGRKGESE